MTRVNFKCVSPALAARLMGFVSRRNIGKDVIIDGRTYHLDHISQSSSSFFQSRGLSVYFTVGRSVIRISDHWTSSRGYDRSDKLNCGLIGGDWWHVANAPGAAFAWSGCGSGKYPWRMLAGKAGKAVLNPSCEYWRYARYKGPVP